MKLKKELKKMTEFTTPKQTLDWYVKWIASIFVLLAMSLRGIDEMIMWDLTSMFVAF